MPTSRPRAACRLLATALLVASGGASAQVATWQVWATGLPVGIFPRIAVAPDHSLYYGLLGGGTPGVIARAPDARAASGTFTLMPPIPYVTIQNNVEGLTTTAASEPVVGIFHASAQGNLNDPIAFVYDWGANQWITAPVSVPANLGVFAMARAPNGDIWFGAKWSRVYRSTDNGRSYTAIDESALVAASAPCFYPTLGGVDADGAIYSINVDRHGRVYAGTETAGLVYSDDNGATWKPADAFACLANDSSQRNPASPMEPLTRSGNLGAIGFTADDNVVWNGANLWYFNALDPHWISSVAFADMTAQTITPAAGFVTNFIYKGLQVSRIVTTAKGTLFLHSGMNSSFDPNTPQSTTYSLGIYRSPDGVHWTAFNTGFPNPNNGLAEGSLAVDGNRVFMAFGDGKIWYFDDDTLFFDGFGR